MKKTLIHVACVAAFSIGSLHAQVPSLINYQGRVAVGALNFDGSGQFKFALVDVTGGTTYWSNNGTSVLGGEPTAAVSLAVSKGLYSVMLGDTALANMTVITPSVFSNPDVRLRVWFNDGVNGSQLLTPDQRLAAAAYLADGTVRSSSIATGAVTSTKIAAGAVGNSQIAAGSLDFSRLNVPAAPGTGQILSYNGSSLNWITPVVGGGSSGWLLDGNTASSGKFIGTTDNNSLEFRTNNALAFYIRSSDKNLIFPQVPSTFFNGKPSSGLGIYGSSSSGGLTLGRDFGSVDVDGPVLYGESGGALGTTLRTGATPPFYSNGTIVEKPSLVWRNETGDGTTLHVGGYGANADPKLIRFGDGEFVQIGETGTDNTLQLKASRFHFLNGSVGIGTASPTQKLHVAGQNILVDGLGNEKAYMGGDGNGDVEVGSLNSATTLVVFYNPTNNRFMDIRSRDAAVRSLTIYGGADLAEPFAMSHENVEPGAVVVIDILNPGKLRLSNSAYDKKVAGIVSGADGINPGISMIQEDMLEAGENVALSGRVYVKANNSAGEIQPGDLLTTSDTAGEAMKASDHSRAQGAILGKAMTGLSTNSGKVLALVTLQ